MDLRLHPCSVAPAEGHEKCEPRRLTRRWSSCTNACAGKARSRGTRCRDVIFETLFETLWVSNPIRPRSAASRNRVMRGPGVTQGAKRSQGARRPRDRAPKCIEREGRRRGTSVVCPCLVVIPSEFFFRVLGEDLLEADDLRSVFGSVGFTRPRRDAGASGEAGEENQLPPPEGAV